MVTTSVQYRNLLETSNNTFCSLPRVSQWWCSDKPTRKYEWMRLERVGKIHTACSHCQEWLRKWFIYPLSVGSQTRANETYRLVSNPYRRKFHEYGVLALPAGGEQQCYYKQGRLHPAHSGPPMDSALHVLCEVRDDILCCIENLAQKITYECPEYSISSWTSARLPLRLTDEGGPGAGWHL